MIIGFSILFTVSCIYGLASAAVVHTNIDNEVTGIESLYIESYGTYDVDFYYATYSDLYGGMVYDETFAEAAINATNAEINALSPVPELIDYPAGLLTRNHYMLPVLLSGTSEVYVQNGINDTDDNPDMGWEWVQPPGPYNTDFGGYWAEYSQVPIPGAVWLLGSGMIGIMGIRRKYNK
jgi:hypothetical protein